MSHQIIVSQFLYFGPYRARCSCGWKGKKRGWSTFGMAEIEWEHHLR